MCIMEKEIGMLGKNQMNIFEAFLWEEKIKNTISWIKPLYSDSVSAVICSMEG